MISSLRGKLIEKHENSVVIECGGIGYNAFVTYNTRAGLPDKNSEVFLYTYMHVKEGGVELFGFETSSEKEAFLQLTGISGVGPKVGLSILSGLTPDKLAIAVISGDEKALCVANGVGRKLAARIILELKDKFGAELSTITGGDFEPVISLKKGSSQSEAIAALVVLGYSQTEAVTAVSKQDENLTVEEIIKNSLKLL